MFLKNCVSRRGTRRKVLNRAVGVKMSLKFFINESPFFLFDLNVKQLLVKWCTEGRRFQDMKASLLDQVLEPTRKVFVLCGHAFKFFDGGGIVSAAPLEHLGYRYALLMKLMCFVRIL